MREVYILEQVSMDSSTIVKIFSKGIDALLQAIDICNEDRETAYEVFADGLTSDDDLTELYHRYIIFKAFIDRESGEEIIWDSRDYKYIYRGNGHDQG